MLVSQILKSKGDLVFTVSPQETLAEACRLLHERRVGAMVVCDASDRVAGILSERDIVRAVARDGAVALGHFVEAVMTAEVIYADPKETVDQLLTRMTDRRIRHLPVLDGGRLVGVVSIGDLVKSKIAEVEAESQNLKAYIAGG